MRAEDRTHAVLSASGSKRWLSCPPSARLEEQFPYNTSKFAEEGTFAHHLGEIKLKKYLGLIPKREYELDLKGMNGNCYYTPDMISYVEGYVDYVIERINTARAETKDAVIMLEQRLDYSEWVPGGFGTGDVVIITDSYVEIIDLKYGKGVPVSAEGNTQMRLYGLGAYAELSVLYDFNRVIMTICQPRLDSISTDSLSVNGLLEWAEQAVKPAAAIAYKGEGHFAAGEHCQFCRAKAKCKARAEANLEMAKYDFLDPALLADNEIAAILVKAEELQNWAKDVQAHALAEAEKGKKWPGWKLVEGRSNRKYADEEKVVTTLLAAEYSEDQIYKPRELLGISAMESKITRKRFNALLGELIIKPAGKPTLVLKSDKRPEISSVQSAVDDFSDAI